MKHIRKNWRRFAAVLLSAALMISTVSQTAFAAGADTGKAIQLVDGGTAANISGGQASSVYFGTYPQNSAGSGGYHTDPNESGDVHTHCVCGGNGAVNGHEHDTAGTEWTEWTTAASLPGTAGSYYLTQSVSENWAVPAGEVTLCLNGQTINGSITVGGSAKLTLTDCSGNGKIQGGVTVNGGTLELYSGTITGGVQVGIKGGTYQTGSSFTMYGGAITGNKTDSGSGGGVFLVGTTNQTDPPNFTMHGGTISDNTAGASDGGGGGVYVGEKCSFTMDGGTITGNTATNGNGGGIYIHMLSRVTISGGEITNNTASGSGIRYGGGIYSESGVTVSNVTITGNSANEGGGIYGKGAITLTDATVTDNQKYDVYYDGGESSAPKLTVSGSVKAGYYANYAWKLPIRVSGALSEDSVIRVGVYEGIKPNAGGSLLIAEPASGVTLSAENFKADAADSVTSLGEDGKVYLSLCAHEMDDTGYTCKKCHTQFDARIGESAYYQTLAKAFQNAWDGSTITLMRDVNLNGSCSASDTITLDLHGKTITSEDKPIRVNEKLTVKDSSEGGGTQALNVKFSVGSNGTLAVDDSYTGDISYVELRTGGALEAYTGTIQELLLGTGNGTGYSVKLWKDNAHCCTVKTITLAENADQNLTVGGLLETNHAKCELYGEQDGTWSIVDKSTKIVDLTGYTAYNVQFAECVHACSDDTAEKPVCSKCGKALVVKITATASDGKTRTAWFPADSGIENGDGYVEAIQTLNGWSAEGYTDATLMPLCDVHNNSGGSLTITATGTFADADVGNGKAVNLTLGALSGASAGNYKLAASGNQTTATANITAKNVSISAATVNDKDYDGNANATVPSVTITGVSSALSMGTDFDVTSATFPDADADTANVDVTINVALKGTAANNYNLTNGMGYVVTSAAKINKATYSDSAPTKTVNILKNYAGVQTGTLTAADFFTTAPAEAKITNAVPNADSSNMMSNAGADASGNFTYASQTSITAASNENWTITISSKNYTDITATLTFSPVDRTDAGVTISSVPASKTYGESFTLTASVTDAGTGTGSWTWTSNDPSVLQVTGTGASATVKALKAGSATISAKYESDTTMGEQTTAPITVGKRVITVTADNKSMTVNGTLPTFTVTYGNLPSGVQAADIFGTLASASTTTDGKTTGSFDITVTTPVLKAEAGANYEVGAVTKGTLTVNPRSSSGGGGGSSVSTYSVTVGKTDNGSVSVSPKSASKGDTVTITVTPDKGYVLETLTVLDKNDKEIKLTEKNGKYTFTMPASKVTVKATFMDDNTMLNYFVDVKVGDYFYDAVLWAAEKGVTSGTDATHFSPNAACTRAQIVTFLWRAAGSPEPKNMSSFTDVPADSYYAKAVAWAVKNGITGGTGNGKFSPDAPCTRAQMATFLWRANGSPKVTGTTPFSDVSAGTYYCNAVLWAYEQNITNGTGGGKFSPDAPCTRAQMVQMLKNASDAA